MKILAIIVTYYPERDKILKNINAFKDSVDKILIWENTPQPNTLKYRYIQESEKIRYCGPGKNIGIPKALNYAWHYAQHNGYDYVLTMDQDSEWINFEKYLDLTIKGSHKQNIIWGPNTNLNEPLNGFKDVKSIITSGMLVSTNILNHIGGWPKTFKIDCVDLDFCYNARKNDIIIKQVNEALLNQHFGSPKLVKSFKHSNLKEISEYSPKRLYGIIRNGIILGGRYQDFNTLSYLHRWIIVELEFIFLYESKKFKKTESIFKGLISGIYSRLSHNY